MSELMMYDGKIINIFNLQKEDVDSEIIIRGTCRIHRFLGQTAYPYPVASHLIGGWKFLDDIGADILLKKQWLIHEAFESYSGVDLPSPLKAMLPDYKEAENRALKVIAEAFGVNPAESDKVKKLDRAIMVAEALVLMPNQAYWKQFAKDNDIRPIGSEYVLSEQNPQVLKTMLEDIWDKTFYPNRPKKAFLVNLNSNLFEWVEVDSLREASILCRAYIERFGLCASNWTGGEVKDTLTNQFAARISYNGRIWDKNDKELG